MRSKVDTRRRTGIFDGYADDHAGNIYRFINVQTKKIILSRDLQWLNSFWKQNKTRNNDSRNLVEYFSQMMRMIRIWKKVLQKSTKSWVMATTQWNKRNLVSILTGSVQGKTNWVLEGIVATQRTNGQTVCS